MFSAVENGRPIEENNNQDDSNVKKPPLRSLDVFAGCGGGFLFSFLLQSVSQSFLHLLGNPLNKFLNDIENGLIRKKVMLILFTIYITLQNLYDLQHLSYKKLNNIS